MVKTPVKESIAIASNSALGLESARRYFKA